MDVASLTNAPRLMHGGAGIKGPRIESGVGDPLGSFESFRQDEQFPQDAQATLMRDSGAGRQQLQRLGEECTAASKVEQLLFPG